MSTQNLNQGSNIYKEILLYMKRYVNYSLLTKFK